MKKLLHIFLLLFPLLFLGGGRGWSQSLQVDSTRFITGLRCCTNIFFTIPTADKGLLFAGYEISNPGGIIPYFPIDSSGENVLIGKIDSNQQISWIKVYGGSQPDLAESACQTSDGGYAILATTSSDDGDVTNFHGANDYWLLRLDASGNLLWENCYGGPGGEQAASVALTPDGGFILLGTTNEVGGEVTFHYGGEFDYDWWVVKTDSLGTLQWAQTLGGTGQESDNGTILSIGQAYYLISSSTSTDHNCTDTFWHPGVNTGYDYYVLKLDTGGNVLWDSSYGGSNDEDEAYAIFDARDSTIVINGGTHSDNYMVTGYQGDGDMWVVKLNKNGTMFWEKAFGYATADNGANGLCTASGNGYMAYGGTSAGMIGPANAWIVFLDSNGNEITNLIYGGAGSEMPSSIIPYLNGYVAAGTSSSSVFTEGSCDTNYSGAYVSYIGYLPLMVNNINKNPDQLQMYPNPANEEVTIEAAQAGNYTIVITDVLGRLIYKANYVDKAKIVVSGWMDGIYYVQTISENGEQVTKRLIVK